MLSFYTWCPDPHLGTYCSTCTLYYCIILLYKIPGMCLVTNTAVSCDGVSSAAWVLLCLNLSYQRVYATSTIYCRPPIPYCTRCMIIIQNMRSRLQPGRVDLVSRLIPTSYKIITTIPVFYLGFYPCFHPCREGCNLLTGILPILPYPQCHTRRNIT